jgi:hypothetical protein
MNENFFSKVRMAIPFLAHRSFQGMRVSLWGKIRQSKSYWVSALAAFLFCVIGNSEAFQGYNVVITTSSSVETSFLASTTAQFQAILTPNPFASNTYAVNLFGFNPNYVAPGQIVPSAPCQLDQDISNMVANSTWTFVYGFADGMTYQQNQETGVVGYFGNLCRSATYFNLIESSTKTFSAATCSDVIETIENQLFNLSVSTPIVIPPEP